MYVCVGFLCVNYTIILDFSRGFFVCACNRLVFGGGEDDQAKANLSQFGIALFVFQVVPRVTVIEIVGAARAHAEPNRGGNLEMPPPFFSRLSTRLIPPPPILLTESRCFRCSIPPEAFLNWPV